VRPATIAAAVLACAAAVMVVVAFATGGEEQRAASAPAPAAAPPEPAAAREGEAVWVAHGCGSCHSFAPADAEGVFGPNLSATLKGMPASYIRESIVNPSKVAAAGYSAGMMPEDYGARIPPADLDALVEYLRAGVRD
jgi:mono/diheme cytochrome c family protein